MAPVRGPGRSGRKPLGPTRPGCSASREIGGTSAECSALVPLRGPLRATVRPSVVPLRASARPGFLLPRSFAGAGGGRRGSVGPGRPSAPFGSLRWPRATAAPPAPVARFRAPPHAPSPARPAGRARRVRGLGGVGRPWPAPCSLWSPCAALRPPRPPFGPSWVPPALPPLRGPPPGRPGSSRRAGLAGRFAPGFPPPPRPALGECHRQASPARVKPGGQRPPLPGRPACGMWALSPQKGGLTSSNTCATMMGQGRPAFHRQPCAGRRPWWRAGAFFACPSRPPPSGGGAQGHGDAAHPPPSATGGDEGTKRGVRTNCPHPSGVSWSPVRTQQNGRLFC